MSYNSYFPGSQQLIWVRGKEGADGFLIAPNNTVPLWDMEEPVIYLKSAFIDKSEKRIAKGYIRTSEA